MLPTVTSPPGPAGVSAETVADLFEQAVARAPAATAVVAGEHALSYAELDERANRLAHHLRAAGVGPEVPVAVHLERSLDLAVSLLAVLKAGGACLPIDPAYPSDRLALMLDDAHVGAVLTSAALADRLPRTGAPVVHVDTDAGAWDALPSTSPARAEPRTDGLAYLIYTSGSTGRPKGVELTHGGLVNHHRAVVSLYGLAPGDRVLQFCSLGFDASIEELFPTWAAGATVVFRPDGAPLLGRSWLDWLRRNGITVVNLPTAYWHEWARELDASGDEVPPSIRLVVVGGEKARGRALRAWRRAAGGRSRWINVYGPTETTCMSTSWAVGALDDLDDLDGGWDPPIGRPIANTTVRVVDHELRPVPAGEAGELLIGGAGLARGYPNDPELTALRFVGEPRMYRTGDLVRERPGGDLEFVGRLDDQVKIRGFRVECGDVEAAIAAHPSVAAAAVVPNHDAAGETELVAYAVAPETTVDALRRFVTARLPSYMVPAAFVVLDALPLTPNGKVDRTALPPLPPAAARRPRPSARPLSPTEAVIAAVWGRVLGVDAGAISPDGDFFALGGHSLLATQVIAQLREELGTDTPLRAIFEDSTVAGLAAAIEGEMGGARAARSAPLRPRAPTAPVALPLSLAQEQMWALEAAASPPGLYNITALHRFDERLDEGALRDALAYLVDRHETLRTGIATDGDGRPYQRVHEAATIDVAVTPVATASEKELERLVAAQDAEPFELARPPLARAGLFVVDGGAGRLAVTLDHLVCDGNGVAIFMGELLDAYAAFRSRGRAPDLPALGVQFADFALWQRTTVTDEVLGRQLEWWRGALDGMPLGPALPFDRVPDVPTRRIAHRPVAVPAETRRRLDRVARTSDSTLFVVVLAAVQAVLARAGGSTDIVLSTTLSGRNRAEVERLVGMFSGVGRLRTDLSGDPPFTEAVTRAREFVLGLFENQDIPFLRVRQALLPHFPRGGVELASALPVEFGYFHTSPDDPELFFRGQLHPLSVTLLDDGERIAGEVTAKLDFYEPATIERLARDLERVLDAVAADPVLRLSALPVSGWERRRPDDC